MTVTQTEVRWRICRCVLQLLQVTSLRTAPLQNCHTGLESERLSVFKYHLCISSITHLLGNFLAVDRERDNFVFKVCSESTMTTDCSNYFLTEGSLNRDSYCSYGFLGVMFVIIYDRFVNTQ